MEAAESLINIQLHTDKQNWTEIVNTLDVEDYKWAADIISYAMITKGGKPLEPQESVTYIEYTLPLVEDIPLVEQGVEGGFPLVEDIPLVEQGVEGGFPLDFVIVPEATASIATASIANASIAIASIANAPEKKVTNEGGLGSWLYNWLGWEDIPS